MGLLNLPVVDRRLRDVIAGMRSERAQDDTMTRTQIEQHLLHNDTTIQSYLIEAFKQAVIPPLDLQLSEDDIVDAYQQYRQDYLQDERRSFEHIYFDFKQPATIIDTTIKALHVEPSLNTSLLGDRFIEGGNFENLSQQEVSDRLGTVFAERVFAQPRDQWFGPIASAYGNHVVRIYDIRASQPLTLQVVKPRLISRLTHEANLSYEREYISRLVANYKVFLPQELAIYRGQQ